MWWLPEGDDGVVAGASSRAPRACWLATVCPQDLQNGHACGPQARHRQSTAGGVAPQRRWWGEPGPDLVTGARGASFSAGEADLRHVAQEHVGRFGRRRDL